MPTATYEELLTEVLPERLEGHQQYRQISARLGDLIGAGRSRTPDETRLMHLLVLLVEDYDRRNALPASAATSMKR